MHTYMKSLSNNHTKNDAETEASLRNWTKQKLNLLSKSLLFSLGKALTLKYKVTITRKLT